MARGAVPDVKNLISVKVDGIIADQVSVIDVKEELREKFGKFGEIGDVYIPRDRNFAFVRFVSKTDAEDAIEGMDGKSIGGVEVSVSMSMQAKRMPQDFARDRYGDRNRSRSRGHRRRDSRE